MRISFQSEPKLDFSLKNKRKIKEWIEQVCKKEKKEIAKVTYFFCTDKYLLNLNSKFLKHDTLTDIITFDYGDKENKEGEIFISVERVKENALNFNESFERELNRVIIHGVLHLCGYKDKTEKDKKKMRVVEDIYLKVLSPKHLKGL